MSSDRPVVDSGLDSADVTERDPERHRTADRKSGSALGTDAQTNLDRRYGRTRTRARWNRRGAWIVAAAFVAVFAAWVVWAGLDGTTAEVDTLDVGHRVVDDTSVSVTWQVTLEPGDAARCALEAQNEAHGVVGWKIVDIAASDQRIRRFTETVNTSEVPVTGLIYRCWPA